ncbi:MAG: glycoside hydrolase family 172 protein [Anaerolineae bacterium]
MFAAPPPYLLSNLQSRSISASNPTGGKGAAPTSWRHCLNGIRPGEIVTLAEIDGPGTIRHIWLTFPNRTPERLRGLVIRIYWDGSEHPSVAAPVGDFFGLAHGRAAHLSTPYIGVSEGKGFNCFFPMPFSRHCRVTIENDTMDELNGMFYQVSYTLGDEITADMGRFHAHFRRAKPDRGTTYLMLETKGTPGVYVGATFGVLPLEAGTWREGEIRFYIDGDGERPTIVGTGWSDWFLSGWGLGIHQSLYAGSTYQVLHPELGDKYFCSCFRFHVMDPIYFQQDLRIEHTQVGARPGLPGHVQERADDWSSVVYWYQNLVAEPLPDLPSRAERLAGIAVPEWEAAAIARMRSGVDRRHDSD